MRRWIASLSIIVLIVPAASATAAETLRYEWRLRSPLSWIARIKFPTSGTGVLRTMQASGLVESSLHVDAGGAGHFELRSTMDRTLSRTLTSRSHYALGRTTEVKETVYDYFAGVARTVDTDNGSTEVKTRPLPADQARDALTVIAYLRRHAAEVGTPLRTEVFSDGKRYAVTIQPKGTRDFRSDGQKISAVVFEILREGQKKDGGFTIWLSADERRLPLRIILEQKYGSIDLLLVHS